VVGIALRVNAAGNKQRTETQQYLVHVFLLLRQEAPV
jgi:hypothetical protein